MKRNICFIIIWMVVFGFSCSYLRDKAYELAYEIISDLGEEGYKVESKETMIDFANNTYTLFNLNPNGYLIVNDESSVMVEGSFIVDSPYAYYVGEKYYLGPLNYNVKNYDEFYSIVDQKTFEYSSDLNTNSMKLINNLKYAYEDKISSIDYTSENNFSIKKSLNSGEILLNPNGSLMDTSGWTMITYHHFFSHLNYFPENKDGTCGFVALSMILGFLDTFYHDDTIPNKSVFKNGRYYNFTQKVYYTGTPNTSYISHDLWTRSPGTTDDLHDVLFDYGHHIPWFEGHPATGTSLKSTFNDYRNEFIQAAIRDNFSPIVGTFFNTHKKPRELIDNGIPTILVMSKYDSNIKNGTFHDVVTYGYKDEMF